MPPSITLTFVDTTSHVLSRTALEASLAQFKVANVIVVTDRPEMFPGYNPIRVTPFPSFREYCRYLTHELVHHISTDVMLMAQYDGFILNGAEYSPHFAHYDYIGAPWPMFEEHAVGNGGFSWRSKRLMEAVASLPYDGVVPEDLFICRQNRVLLETQFGIRFAGRDLASHFSQELVAKPYPSFGFHGIFHLPSVYARQIEFLVEHLAPEAFLDPHKYAHLRQAFARVGPDALAQYEGRRSILLAARASAGDNS